MNTNNLNYKDTVIARSEVTKQSRELNTLTPHPSPSPSRGEGYCSLCSQSLIFNFQSSIFNFSKSAFSLIELSIVLIIIGLLIAGVTGGASLIQSAKVRSMINELKEYERAVYTFQAARGRYPGDVKNYGTFGRRSNYYNDASNNSAKPYYEYKASDFPADFLTEFQKTAGSGVVPNAYSAPFVELYNEGIIDFKPLGNTATADKSNSSANGSKKATPSLKSEPKAYIRFMHTGTYPTFTSSPCVKGVNGCIYENGLVYNGQIKETLSLYYDGYSATKGFDPKFLKAVDEKFDDGWYSTGVVRGGCYGSSSNSISSSYDNAMENGKKCWHFYYAI